jgi:nicotinamidase-related amidase
MLYSQEYGDGSFPDNKPQVWDVSVPEFRAHTINYIEALEKNGRFTLTIWPEHCLVGTRGHAVHETLEKALHGWEESNKTAVNFIFKGNISLCGENGSVLCALLIYIVSLDSMVFLQK